MPCWEMMHCPRPVQVDCPAIHHRRYPCWEIEGTYCKWDRWGAQGRDTTICLVCEVYLKWGGSQPISLKLKGCGIRLLIR